MAMLNGWHAVEANWSWWGWEGRERLHVKMQRHRNQVHGSPGEKEGCKGLQRHFRTREQIECGWPDIGKTQE